MTESTKRPWLVGVDEHGENLEISTQDRCLGNVVPIASVSIGYDGPVEAEQHANAELIVRAVNAHDELVEALRFYASPENWKLRGGNIMPSMIEGDRGERARLALARALGEAQS